MRKTATAKDLTHLKFTIISEKARSMVIKQTKRVISIPNIQEYSNIREICTTFILSGDIEGVA